MDSKLLKALLNKHRKNLSQYDAEVRAKLKANRYAK